MKIKTVSRSVLATGALLTLGGCDWNNPPPPPPVVVVDPYDPSKIIVIDQPMPPPQEPREFSEMLCIPTVIPVFEGAHPGWTGRPPAEWQFPDTANTSSTEDLWFSMGFAKVREAQWIVVWNPTNDKHFCRFVAMPMGEGYGTWSEITQIQGAEDKYGWGPRSYRFNCTQYFQDAQANKKDTYIGFQVMGDGVAPMTVWKSRLLMVWEPGA
jgi:hypothetical protein